MSIVEFKDVTRVYTSGDHEQKALDEISHWTRESLL